MVERGRYKRSEQELKEPVGGKNKLSWEGAERGIPLSYNHRGEKMTVGVSDLLLF